MELHRRTWLAALGAGTVSALTTRGAKADEAGCPASDGPLRLQDFRPKSMLHVAETRVATPRFPVIDVHTHFSFAKGGRQGAASDDSVAFTTTAEDALAVMDRKGVRAVVNLTGGFGKGLEQAIARFDQAHPGRFYTCTEPMWGAWADPRFPQLQADAIENAARAGAKGLKVLKTLGLFLRERGREGPLVKVDDRRFDPMWEACAAHRLPVYIHVSDPEAFFLPIDCTNERWDELGHHPDWSFHGKDFPSHRELMQARDRVLERHPKTLFVGLHVGQRPGRRVEQAIPRDYVAALPVQHNDMFQPRQLSLQFPYPWQAAGIGNHRARLRLRKARRDFGLGAPGTDGDKDQSGFGGGKHGQHKFRNVRQDDPQPVPRPQPQRAQPGGDSRRLLLGGGIRPAFVTHH